MDTNVKMRQDSDLAERIAAFKREPEKLREATDFVNGIIQEAQKEAENKLKEKERPKVESQSQDLGSGTNLKRRLGRARGFVMRMFDALCNCTQTAAAAARTTARNNPFTKR